MVHSTLETGIDESSRTIYLQEEVGEGMFRRVSVALDAFLRQPRGKSRPVMIHLMSPGGDVLSAQAVAALIERFPAPITVVAHRAYSAACTCVLQAADTRLALPYSHFMLHGGVVGISEEKQDFVEVLLKELKETNQAMIDYMIGRGAEKGVQKLMTNGKDNFFGATTALELGLIDGILE